MAGNTDRLDPTVGYVPENIIICCYRCNVIKNDTTPDELRTLADAIETPLARRNLDGSTP